MVDTTSYTLQIASIPSAPSSLTFSKDGYVNQPYDYILVKGQGAITVPYISPNIFPYVDKGIVLLNPDPRNVVLSSELGLTEVPEGRLLKKGAGPVQLDALEARQTEPDGKIVFPPGFQVESHSIDFVEIVTLTELCGFLGIYNHRDAFQFALVDSRFDKVVGSYHPRIFKLDPEITYTVQNDDTTLLTGDPIVFILPIAFDAQINSITFKAAVAVDNLRIVIRDNATSVAYKFFPSFIDNLDQSGFSFAPGPNVIDFGFSQLRFTAGQTLRVEVYGDNLQLLGNSAGVPYIEAQLQPASFADLAYLSDIGSGSVQSVGLTANPSIFNVSGSPVTSTGTLDLELNSQTANKVLASPDGTSGIPSFRPLVKGDVPFIHDELYAENPTVFSSPMALGSNTVSLGNDSSSIGDESFSLGKGAISRIYGTKVLSNGFFNAASDSQFMIVQLRNLTMDNSLTNLFLDFPLGTTRLEVEPSAVWNFTVNILAKRMDSLGELASWKFEGTLSNFGGTLTFCSNISKTVLCKTSSVPWDANLNLDTVFFNIQVTGENSKTIRWLATVHITQII